MWHPWNLNVIHVISSKPMINYSSDVLNRMSIKQQALHPIGCHELFWVFHTGERIKFVYSLQVFFHILWGFWLLSTFFVSSFVYYILDGLSLFKLFLNIVHVQVVINGSVIVDELNGFLWETFFLSKSGLDVIQC